MSLLLIRDSIQSVAYYLGEILLFQLAGANLQAKGVDQIFQKMFAGSNYDVSRAYVRQRSGTAAGSGSAVIYDQIAQTGNELFPSISFSGFTTLGPNVGISALPTPGVVPLFTNVPFFNVTTAAGAPCTADIFIYGHDVT